MSKIEGLLRRIVRLRQVAPEEKSLVFSQYPDALKLVGKALTVNNINWVELRGGAKVSSCCFPALFPAVYLQQLNVHIHTLLIGTRKPSSRVLGWKGMHQPNKHHSIRLQATMRVLIIMHIMCLGAPPPLLGLGFAWLILSCLLLATCCCCCCATPSGTQESGTPVCLQASAAVRDFETKDDIRVFLLPHKVGAAGLTLNRGWYPHQLVLTLYAACVCAVLPPIHLCSLDTTAVPDSYRLPRSAQS